MPSERFDFPGREGQRLAARLDLPVGEPRGTALFAHCFTCGKDSRAAARIAGALAKNGIACLRFDFTGLGGSEGEFGNSGFSSNLDDLVLAAAELRRRGHAPSLLIGHSLGGAAVIAAAPRIEGVEAVAVIGAPADVSHILVHFEDRLPAIEAAGEAEVLLGGRTFRISHSFVEDVHLHDLPASAAALGKPLLVLHAPADQIVGIDNARMIFEAARHPKSFVALDDADHLLSRSRDAVFVADVIAAWAMRHMPEPAPAAEPAGREGLVVVEQTGEGRFQQAITAGGTQFLADEPAALGGLGTGATPYDLLAASLGACTAMTLRLHADREKWPLESVRVVLRHEKVHAQDGTDCMTRNAKIDVFEREISLQGPLDAAQREGLLRIADKCPVHRTLHGPVEVVTKLAEG